jgi:hypothetical protein
MAEVTKKAEVIPLTDDPDHPLNPKHAAIVIKRLWREGRVTWRQHGKKQRGQRDFDTLEVEALVLKGTVVGPSGRSESCWKYEIEDRQQTQRLVVAVRRNTIQIITIIRLGRI